MQKYCHFLPIPVLMGLCSSALSGVASISYPFNLGWLWDLLRSVEVWYVSSEPWPQKALQAPAFCFGTQPLPWEWTRPACWWVRHLLQKSHIIPAEAIKTSQNSTDQLADCRHRSDSIRTTQMTLWLTEIIHCWVLSHHVLGWFDNTAMVMCTIGIFKLSMS